MDADDRTIEIAPQPVRHATLRLRVPDAMPDESLFFVVALLAGAVCGYLVATV